MDRPSMRTGHAALPAAVDDVCRAPEGLRPPLDLARGEIPASAGPPLADAVDWHDVVRHGFGYAPPAGSARLREAFVEHLARVARDPGEVLVTHGTLGALDLALRLRHPGTRFFALDPTYREALTLARRHRLRPTAIHQHDGGLDLDRLEDELGPDDVVYLVPSLNNPDGRTLTLAERTRVADVVVAAGAALLEDDAYRHLDAARLATPSVTELVVARRPSARALRLLSFSKTVAPGTRTCVVEGGREAVQDLLHAKADFGTCPLASELVATVLQAPRLWATALEATVERLDQGRRAALGALDGWPGGVHDPGAGYFLWLPVVTAPTARFVSSARAHGVAVADGTPFGVDGTGSTHVRLSVAWEHPDLVAAGAARLLRCRDLLRETST